MNNKYILIDGIDLSGKSSVAKSFKEEGRQILDKIPYQEGLYNTQDLLTKNLSFKNRNNQERITKCSTSYKIQKNFQTGALLYFLKEIKEDLSYLHNEQFIQTIENINKSGIKPKDNTIQESLVSLRVMAYNHIKGENTINKRLLETLKENPFDSAFILTADEEIRKERAKIRQSEDSNTLTAMDRFVLKNPQAAKDMSDYIVNVAKDYLGAKEIDTSNININQVIKIIKNDSSI